MWCQRQLTLSNRNFQQTKWATCQGRRGCFQGKRMNLQMNLRPGYVFTKLINKKGFFQRTPPERDDKQLMKGEKSKKKRQEKRQRNSSFPRSLPGGETGLDSGKKTKIGHLELNQMDGLERGSEISIPKIVFPVSLSRRRSQGVTGKFGLRDFLRVSVELTGLDLKTSSVRENDKVGGEKGIVRMIKSSTRKDEFLWQEKSRNKSRTCK